MNQNFAADRLGDSRLQARVESYELAAKMQLAAPEVFDLSRETAFIHERYGTSRPGADGAFSRNCLLARRFAERGVRFVQVWSGAGGPKIIGITILIFQPNCLPSLSKLINLLLRF